MRSATPSGQDSGPTTGFAPASSGLQGRRLSQSSHVGNQAGVRGVEPRWAVLEAACSPRTHSCNSPRPFDREPWRNDYSVNWTFQ